MTNPTRQEIINAHEALEDMHHIARKTTEKWDEEGLTDFWKSLILRALPPLPRPTMAEVEWEDDLHYLAEATDRFGTTVLMLGETSGGNIRCIAPAKRLHEQLTPPDNLTPTGKRYKLTEVQE